MIKHIRTLVTFSGTAAEWERLAVHLETSGETRLTQTIRNSVPRQQRRWYRDSAAMIPLRFTGKSPEKIQKAITDLWTD